MPRPGWQAWVTDEATFLAWDGTAWEAAGLPAFFSDATFALAHDADPTRRAVFDLTSIAAGATRSFALPDVSTELAGLSGAQQIADWGALFGPGDTLDVRIYQLSALVGRGTPNTVTLQS